MELSEHILVIMQPTIRFIKWHPNSGHSFLKKQTSLKQLETWLLGNLYSDSSPELNLNVFFNKRKADKTGGH